MCRRWERFDRLRLVLRTASNVPPVSADRVGLTAFKGDTYFCLSVLVCRFVFIGGCYLLWPCMAGGQAPVPTTITPDHTMGTQVTSAGNVHAITGGRRPDNGRNLFHSFARFDLGTQDIAHFTGPAAGIENIISRVTGGQQSHIDGQIASTMPGANLFFMNPHGVLFGPNASLNLQGSFHVSTADYLRFADGASFAADLGSESTLTVAPPAAFGFLSQTMAGITIQGSSLRVGSGATLSITGGNLTIAGNPAAFFPAPTLAAPDGRIDLTSVASPGEVELPSATPTADLPMTGDRRLGTIHLTNAAGLDASGQSGGTIRIRAGQLQMVGAQLQATTQTGLDSAAVGIDLAVTDSLALTDGATLTTTTTGPGPGGDIAIEAGRLTLDQGARVTSTTQGTGAGGTVRLRAAETVAISGGRDVVLPFAPGLVDRQPTEVSSTTTGPGPGGDIAIEAGRLTLGQGARITSTSRGDGPGGAVHLRATETVRVSGFQVVNVPFVPDVVVQVPSTVSSAMEADGQGGQITVTAPTVHLAERGTIQTTTASGSGRHAGTIDVQAGQLMLESGAEMHSGPIGGGEGSGGTVQIKATEAVTLSGFTPDPNDPDALQVSQLSSLTRGREKAGGVFMTAPRVHLTDRARIVATTAGDAGGEAGSIDLNIGQLSLIDGAQILTTTSGTGRGGMVQVRATDAITIAGGVDARGPASEAQASGIRSTTSASGEGGTIALEATTIRLTQGAVITSSSNGTGNAGAIRMTGRDTFVSEQSAVTTEAAQADGGNVHVTARTLVQLRDSNLTAAVQGGAVTAGGNITIGSPTITPEAVVLRNSTVDTTATDGQGGNIQITAQVFLQDTDSLVDAHSDRGIDGEVEIEAITNLHGLVESLSKNFMTAAALLRSQCAAQLREGTVSSLVVRERDGIPATPDGILPSRLSAVGPATTPLSARRHNASTGPARNRSLDHSGRFQVGRQPAVNSIPQAWRLQCESLDSPRKTSPQ